MPSNSFSKSCSAAQALLRPLTSSLALCLALALQACSLSSHKPESAAPLGQRADLAQLEALMDQPGPLTLQSINSADWQVPLSGLLNLKSAAAQAAQLQDRSEAIQIYAHVLQHPSQGSFLVDTGVSSRLLADPSSYGVNWMIRQFMPLDKIEIKQSTEQIVQQLPGSLRGVFLTHMHIDHIAGMPAIPASVPVYVGKGESSHSSFQNMFVRGASDGLMPTKISLREWEFTAPTGVAAASLSSVVDVFGDGSLFALHVPGHTPGSTAYLARTVDGPVLLVGDTSHTEWGWQHGVEPGSYTGDQTLNLQSLQSLKALAARHPKLKIRLGHQAHL
ncbi:MBL fold metallo-hydrolase [Paucibacter sp. AS339]|uniref:MBL fold metallo-hydrolase n=1 Tax=Paucibacter hankyongi TaxID=3133434 RepID=UPI00309A1C09